VPLVTNGISYAWIKLGEPFFTFALLDPNDHSTTTGLSDMFADGVTLSPGLNLPAKYFGKSAKHSITFAITTKEYTPFDAIKQVIIPGPLFPIEPQGGSWSLGYTFRQYLVERGHLDGWGFFSQVSFADQDTSPITTFLDLGIGGNGLFAARPRDEFGIAYAFTDLSDELKDNLDLITDARQRAEHQFEIFYNAHLTPSFKLTGDLQIIRPTRPVADTAIVPGVRLGIVF
jgi:porin